MKDVNATAKFTCIELPELHPSVSQYSQKSTCIYELDSEGHFPTDWPAGMVTQSLMVKVFWSLEVDTFFMHTAFLSPKELKLQVLM